MFKTDILRIDAKYSSFSQTPSRGGLIGLVKSPSIKANLWGSLDEHAALLNSV
jgi:hypothetical protein